MYIYIYIYTHIYIFFHLDMNAEKCYLHTLAECGIKERKI